MKHLSFLLLVALPMGAQKTVSSPSKPPYHPMVDAWCDAKLNNCGVDPVVGQQKQPSCYDEACKYKHSWSFNTNVDYLTIPSGLFPEAVSVETRESTVVKLSDSEYSNLQKLRQAVVDEEKRLAVKYGAQVLPVFPLGCPNDKCVGNEWENDHYTFHGQFLLIDRGYASGIRDAPAEILKHFGTEGMNNPIILNRFPDGSVLKGSAK